MIDRVLALTRYFLSDLARSLAGVAYLGISLAFVYLFFLQQESPDPDYYVLILAAFGAGATFLITLSIAGRAHRADNMAWVGRLPSRVEYLVAVLLGALIAAGGLQLLLALLALLAGPELTPRIVFEIPPVWISFNILMGVLALHATDLVTKGWSRVWVYGTLLMLLFLNSGAAVITRWTGEQMRSAARFFSQRGLLSLTTLLNDGSFWLGDGGVDFLRNTVGILFWPFRAIVDANLGGFYTAAQALAPAFLLLYATILLLIAADLFAGKDLFFTE